MHKTNVLAIVPYEGLKEQLNAMASSRPDINLTAYVGDMEEGLAIAKTMVGSGFDAILSRGGTATLIKQAVSIPVIDITPSVLDVLRCIRLAQSSGNQYAVVSHASITNNIGKVFELLKQPIEVHTLTDEMNSNNIARFIASLKKKNVPLIIGGVHTTLIARRLGMEAIMIPSGQESLVAAFDMAVRVHQAVVSQTQQSQLYLKMLEHNGIGLLVYSEQGKLRFSDLPNYPQECTAVVERMVKYIPNVLEAGEIHVHRKNKNFIWHIDGARVEQDRKTNVAFTLRCAPSPFRQDDVLFSYYHIADEADYATLTDTVGAMQRVAKTAASYARTLSPVWILGETGTPAEECARYIHASSVWADHSMAVIECARMPARALSELLHSENSLLNEVHMTICLKDVDRLTSEQQCALIQYAESTLLTRRNRMIYTASSAINADAHLYEHGMQMGDLKLVLPPLRERSEDILGLGSLYLARLNTELGGQAIGFDSDAEELLRSFPWPENQLQLIRVLRQLALVAEDGVISHRELMQALQNEVCKSICIPESPIQLDGTLEEINRRIIMLVLAEEGMSRTKTIERLGISRSTLWRILKQKE